MRTRIKVCCIASVQEANAAIKAGADALGLVGSMPSGPGPIKDELIAEIAAMVPPPVSTFLLTSETTAAGICRHVQVTQPTAVQIVAPIEPHEIAVLSELDARTRRVQVIHVEGWQALDMIADYASFVHAFLLDSGRPAASIPEFGGTGRVHDWRVSRAFVERSPVPVFLAGGLTVRNVGEAVRTVRPYGLDLCSGVRTDGHLDMGKLAAFMSQVREADETA